MTKVFKKGQTVVFFESLDGKGTWAFTRAIVKSCGEKKMTLLNLETEEMLGYNFRPNEDKSYDQVWNGETFVNHYTYFTLADMSDEEAHAVCIESAKTYIMEADDKARLHEPRSIKK